MDVVYVRQFKSKDCFSIEYLVTIENKQNWVFCILFAIKNNSVHCIYKCCFET